MHHSTPLNAARLTQITREIALHMANNDGLTPISRTEIEPIDPESVAHLRALVALHGCRKLVSAMAEIAARDGPTHSKLASQHNPGILRSMAALLYG